jgi:neutral ceramidase
MSRRSPRELATLLASVTFSVVLSFGTSTLHAQADRKEAAKGEGSRVFRAGAATSNITPTLGEPIVGGFSTPAATHIHDDLHARCLVLDDGKNVLAFVICDNVGISREVFDAARKMIHAEAGLPEENILMAATHTHSATSARWTNNLVPDKDVPPYHQMVSRRIADGVRCALNNRQPARIGWGSADVPTQVFNRRWHLKPGTPNPNPFGGQDPVRMNPGRMNPALVEPAGPTDPQVSFIAVQSTHGRPIALLANYSLHYVGGVGPGHISADYFAVFADRIGVLLGADRLDPPFVGIMTNGTSGDVNNIDVTKKDERRSPYAKIREVADEVADAVYRAHQKVAWQDWVPLAAARRDLVLKVRKPDEKVLAYVRQVLAKPEDAKPYHVNERTYARRALQLHESPDEVAVPLQALRIGALGIAAIPFEVFTETGLEIKRRSPLQPAFTIELANGSYGYLPTPRQHAVGGYETWLGTNKVEVDASDKIVKVVLELLESLRPANP